MFKLTVSGCAGDAEFLLDFLEAYHGAESSFLAPEYDFILEDGVEGIATHDIIAQVIRGIVVILIDISGKREPVVLIPLAVIVKGVVVRFHP